MFTGAGPLEKIQGDAPYLAKLVQITPITICLWMFMVDMILTYYSYGYTPTDITGGEPPC